MQESSRKVTNNRTLQAQSQKLHDKIQFESKAKHSLTLVKMINGLLKGESHLRILKSIVRGQHRKSFCMSLIKFYRIWYYHQAKLIL
jgi:hypothetical protein